MNRRRYLALGLAIVVAGIMGLYIIVASNDDASARTTPASPKNAETAHAAPRADVTPALPSARDVRTVARPVAPAGASSTGDDYTIGDVRVRDHRTGEHPRFDVPPVIHAPRGRKIPPQLASDIARKVRSAVAACAPNVPAEARAAKPRIEGEVTIAIKNQQASITSIAVQLRDVVGVAADAAKQCVEQKSVGLSTPSGDEPDLDGYGITLSLRLP